MLNKTIARLGTKELRPVRCRVIFIFNESRLTNLKVGCLSQALFKLLSKYPTMEMPPLKKRKEDIPELAQHFFAQYQIARYKKIDRTFIELLVKHRWMMNILELKSFIKSLVIPPDENAIQQRERIELARIDLMIDEKREFSLRETVSIIENVFVRQTLKEYGGKQSKAAQSLGMTDRGIRRVLKSISDY